MAAIDDFAAASNDRERRRHRRCLVCLVEELAAGAFALLSEFEEIPQSPAEYPETLGDLGDKGDWEVVVHANRQIQVVYKEAQGLLSREKDTLLYEDKQRLQREFALAQDKTMQLEEEQRVLAEQRKKQGDRQKALEQAEASVQVNLALEMKRLQDESDARLEQRRLQLEIDAHEDLAARREELQQVVDRDKAEDVFNRASPVLKEALPAAETINGLPITLSGIQNVIVKVVDDDLRVRNRLMKNTKEMLEDVEEFLAKELPGYAKNLEDINSSMNTMKETLYQSLRQEVVSALGPNMERRQVVDKSIESIAEILGRLDLPRGEEKIRAIRDDPNKDLWDSCRSILSGLVHVRGGGNDQS
ncbi:Fc.00g031720.m01.CDS01 [Cosmosporella sp. VM-42]